MVKAGALAPTLCHVGDGNFHVRILIMPDDVAEIERVGTLNDRLVARARHGRHPNWLAGHGYGKIGYLAKRVVRNHPIHARHQVGA